MKLSRNSDIYCDVYRNGREEYYSMLKKAGFDAVDLDEFYVPEMYEDGLGLKRGREITDTVKRCGLEIGQCHAPMPGEFYKKSPDTVEKVIKSMEDCVRVASELEIPYTVVHPYIYSWTIPDPDESKTFEFNKEMLTRLCDSAKHTTVCLENLPGPHGFINDGAKMKRMLDSVNGLCACLDTGHLFSVNGKVSDFFMLNGDKIKALHVHDAALGTDLHLLPFSGDGDWDDFSDALHNYGYSGTLNSESKFARTLPGKIHFQAEQFEVTVLKTLIK